MHNLHSKIGTSGGQSDFRKCSKKYISLEVFNMVFRNNSSKGIFGEIMSNSKKLKLSGDRSFLAAFSKFRWFSEGYAQRTRCSHFQLVGKGEKDDSVNHPTVVGPL